MKNKELNTTKNESMKKINISFYLLLVFFIQVIFSDIIIYFTGIRYIFAQIIALVLNILLNVFLIKKNIIKIKNNFNKWDLIFLIIWFSVVSMTIIFPDGFWDSYSYHIYLQKNIFNDKINFDFFPGRTLTTYVFPLADRLFYLFRAKLGFRLGTLPGYLLFIVMFYQIKKILKKFTEKSIKESYLSILSILPLCTFIILQQMGTYYIDNFSIVILLEFIYIVLFENENIFKDKAKLYFLVFIVGLGVCIKITNAIYMILPIVYILIKNIKDIGKLKWYDYILLIIIGILPMFPYLIDTIVQTGSPVFPYYNTIFKSQYFADENWLDTRFGPKNLTQLIFWPFYIIKHPNLAYETAETDLHFVSGYIFSIIYMLYYICYNLIYKRIIKKEKIKLTIEFLYSAYLLYLYLTWGKFVIGYTRYAGIIAVLSAIFAIKILIESIDKKQIAKIVVISWLLCAAAYQGVHNYIGYGSLSNYVSLINGNKDIVGYIKSNISTLLKDQDYLKYDINGIWGVIYDDSAVPSMLNVDDKIVHLEYGTKTGETEISQKIYWDNVLENDIFVPLYNSTLVGKLQYLDLYNFEITEIKDVLTNVTYLNNGGPIYIVKVKYNEDKKLSNQEIFNNLINEM